MSEPKTLRERCEELITFWDAEAQRNPSVFTVWADCADHMKRALAADLDQGPHPESEHAVCLLAIANLQAQLDARGTVWTTTTNPPPSLTEFFGKGGEMADGGSLADALAESRASWPTPWMQLDSIEEPDDDAAPASAPEARQ